MNPVCIEHLEMHKQKQAKGLPPQINHSAAIIVSKGYKVKKLYRQFMFKNP
jgi:hypothetical protein